MKKSIISKGKHINVTTIPEVRNWEKNLWLSDCSWSERYWMFPFFTELISYYSFLICFPVTLSFFLSFRFSRIILIYGPLHLFAICLKNCNSATKALITSYLAFIYEISIISLGISCNEYSSLKTITPIPYFLWNYIFRNHITSLKWFMYLYKKCKRETIVKR